MSLKDRLARLERRRPPGGLTLIVVHGGFSADPEFASADGGLTWRREPGEERAEFIERVRAEAQAAGAKTAIVGGLDD